MLENYVQTGPFVIAHEGIYDIPFLILEKKEFMTLFLKRNRMVVLIVQDLLASLDARLVSIIVADLLSLNMLAPWAAMLCSRSSTMGPLLHLSLLAFALDDA